MRVDRYRFVLYLFITLFWVKMCTGFVFDEILIGKGGIRIFLLQSSSLALLALGGALLRRRSDILFYLGTLGYVFIDTCFINSDSIGRFFLGTTDIIGLIAILPIYRYLYDKSPGHNFTAVFNRQLYIWLILQAFAIVWQFVKYGAGDAVGGTFGNSGSGITSTCIYIVSFLLLMQRWNADEMAASFKANFKYILLLFPTMLNETKVSFVYLVIYFFLLLPFSHKFIKKIFIAVPIAVGLFFIMLPIYLTTTDTKIDTLIDNDFYQNYMVGTDIGDVGERAQMITDGTLEGDDIEDATRVDVPRATKYLFMWPILQDTKGGHAFGAGIGQFAGWNDNNFTRFARLNKWLLNGTKPWIFAVWVQLGWIGVILTSILIIRGIWHRPRGNRKILKMDLFLLAVFALSFLYDDCWRWDGVCLILFYAGFFMKTPAAQQLPYRDS